MAGQPSRTPLAAITGINVTPLVDITLVLSIIFMVTAKLIVGHQAMPLELPKAATGSEVQEIFSVVLFANGSAQVNGRSLRDDDELLPLASAQAKQTSDLRAVIKADGSVMHSRVMHTLDLSRRAGISKIAFGVVPIAPDAQPKRQAK